MTYLEELIARNERRVQKITTNPDPHKLRSNALLYKMELDHYKQVLQRWKEGKAFAAIGSARFSLFLRAMGLEPLELTRFADRLTADRAERGFQHIREIGLPEYGCDRTILIHAMIDAGDLPAPALIVSTQSPCEVISLSQAALARRLGIPCFTIDVDSSEPNEEGLQRVTRQLKELIAFTEGNVPGARYDENRLVELQKIEGEWYRYMSLAYQLRKSSPAPVNGQDVFREGRSPGTFHDAKQALEYAKSYYEDVLFRVRNKIAAVENEQLRFLWAVSGPFVWDPFEFLAQKGVAVPHYHEGEGPRAFGVKYGVYGDMSEYGRQLTPLEDMARMFFGNSWSGLGKRWIDDLLFQCKQFKVDGIVYFLMRGCAMVQGLEKLVVDAARRELGIPVLVFEGREFVWSSSDTARFQEALDDFIRLCLAKKASE